MLTVVHSGTRETCEKGTTRHIASPHPRAYICTGTTAATGHRAMRILWTYTSRMCLRSSVHTTRHASNIGGEPGVMYDQSAVTMC